MEVSAFFAAEKCSWEGRCAADGDGEDAGKGDAAGEVGEGGFVVAEAVEEDEDCGGGFWWGGEV